MTYRLFVRDEAKGALPNPGGLDFPAQANASYTIPWADIERQIRFTPTETYLRVNLVVIGPAGTAPQILLSQTIMNDVVTAPINMTTTCAVNKCWTPRSSAGCPWAAAGSGISPVPAMIRCNRASV